MRIVEKRVFVSYKLIKYQRAFDIIKPAFLTSRKLMTDETVRSPSPCHCEELSDEAIPRNQAPGKYEIASLRSQ
jgi:hypothetical protein